MTKREFLNAIATGTVNEEVIAKANELIAQMDAENAKRRERPSKKAVENAPLIERIVNEILGEEVMTATMVGEALGVSTQKASALCRAAVKEGKAAQVDVKVKGKGVQKGYILG